MRNYLIFFFLVLTSLNIDAFISYEHERLGDMTSLSGIAEPIFTLENGLKITFGELVTMGDYFGKKNESIVIDTATQKPIKDLPLLERRFMDIYNSLNKGSKIEALLILKEIAKEKESIKKAMESGTPEYEAYEKLCSIENIDFTLITKGEYILLSSSNFDHFVDPTLKVAENAFLAGYRLALKTVKDSRNAEDLKKAYAIYGFAAHYLTDIFSAGHMRVPRLGLWQEVHGIAATQISGLLALYQHQEDGCYGINVRNKFATWIAYGDAFLLENPREENMAALTLQKGADEIYNLFIKKTSFEESCSALNDYFPTLLDNNFSPLFKLDEKTNKVLRRKDVTDRFCKEYTSNWFGLTTLIKLYYYNVGAEESFLDDTHLEKIRECLCKTLTIAKNDKAATNMPNLESIASLPEIPDSDLMNLHKQKPLVLSDEHFNLFQQISSHLHADVR